MTAASEAQASVSGAGPRSGLCVLIVEDDEADVYLIRRALAEHPAISDIIYAADGAEALELIGRSAVEPDLAFIDLHMPRKNGFSLLTALAGDKGHGFPMVVLTSSVADTDAIRSRLRGAVRVIIKPDSVEAMRSVLTAAINAVGPRHFRQSTNAGRPRFSTSGQREASAGRSQNSSDDDLQGQDNAGPQ